MLHDNENDLPANHKIGANFPPGAVEPATDPVDENIAALIANADAHVAAHPTIEDAEAGDAAANFLQQLRDHYDELKKSFDEEKVPHEEKLAEIRAKYHPRLERLQICIKSIRPLVRAWINLLENRRKAEEAVRVRVAAEAEQRAQQLAEQAAAGSRNAVTNTIAAAEAAREADAARKALAEMPRRAQVRPSLGGATLSPTKLWRARVVVQDDLYKNLRDHRDVVALLDRLANAAVRAKDGPRPPGRELQGRSDALPGCWIYQEEV